MQKTLTDQRPPHSPAAPAVAGGTFKALCQDCLKVHIYSTQSEQIAAHNEDVFCECGGQLCACDGCLASAAMIVPLGTLPDCFTMRTPESGRDCDGYGCGDCYRVCARWDGGPF